MTENINNTDYSIGIFKGGIPGGIIALLYFPQIDNKSLFSVSGKADEIIYETSLIVKKAKDKFSEIINEATKKSEKNIKDDSNNDFKEAEPNEKSKDKYITPGINKLIESYSKIKEAINNDSDFVNKNKY